LFSEKKTLCGSWQQAFCFLRAFSHHLNICQEQKFGLSAQQINVFYRALPLFYDGF